MRAWEHRGHLRGTRLTVHVGKDEIVSGRFGGLDPDEKAAAAEAFNLKPSECMMVAAHSGDLASAAAVGLHTAHVARPNEYGPNTGEPGPKVPVDYSAKSMMDLADKLGA